MERNPAALSRMNALVVVWMSPAANAAVAVPQMPASQLGSSPRRFAIGKLTRDDQGFEFFYFRGMFDAMEFGLRPLPGLALLDRPMRSRSLCQPFASMRFMPSELPVRDPDDVFERMVRDRVIDSRFEFGEWRAPTDTLLRPLRFATGYPYDTSALTAPVPAALRRQPDNPHDPNAVRVICPPCCVEDFVPRHYAGLISRRLVEGLPLKATIVGTRFGKAWIRVQQA
jgi:hypothetical protein